MLLGEKKASVFSKLCHETTFCVATAFWHNLEIFVGSNVSTTSQALYWKPPRGIRTAGLGWGERGSIEILQPNASHVADRDAASDVHVGVRDVTSGSYRSLLETRHHHHL